MSAERTDEQVVRICPACERGEKRITPPHSSIVGSLSVHYPSGHICMKYLQQEQYDLFMKKVDAARRVERERGEG